jgi:glycerophosphoryl diester phosphodiesterase
MARMIEIGVDGIISDRPDLLRQVAGEKAIALPAATPVEP